MGCIISRVSDKLRFGPWARLRPSRSMFTVSCARIVRAHRSCRSRRTRCVQALEDLERSQPTLYSNLCDETGKVRRHLNVFVNSDHVRDLDGIDTALTPGDVVTFLPAVSGG